MLQEAIGDGSSDEENKSSKKMNNTQLVLANLNNDKSSVSTSDSEDNNVKQVELVDSPELGILYSDPEKSENASVQSPKSDNENSSTPRGSARASRQMTPVNEYGQPLGPGVGLGPQRATEETQEQISKREIFSIGGTRSVKINRHRDNVTVFPSGCMGVKDDKNAENNNPSATPSTVTSGTAANAGPVTYSNHSRSGSAATRNPLTGEGFSDMDFIRQAPIKKRDGNPVLGQGYENKKNSKPQKVPPGGFSHRLW